MEFYVYENWRARGHKAVIHRGDCRNGQGKSTGTNPGNGKWHGGYPGLSAARAASNGLPVSYRLVHRCCG